jgi:hypothetical protein
VRTEEFADGEGEGFAELGVARGLGVGDAAPAALAEGEADWRATAEDVLVQAVRSKRLRTRVRRTSPL